MISFRGTAVNIPHPILGRISVSAVSLVEAPHTIIIDPKMNNDARRNYKASMFNSRQAFEKIHASALPALVCKRASEALKTGDVVEIFPDGKINVLYRIDSRHNIIFVTSRCNSRCIMCPQPPEHKGKEFLCRNLQLIGLIDKSTKELALTGGEPTVLGDDLLKLIMACKQLLPATSLLLLTNGRRFNDYSYTHLFSSLCHPDLTVAIPLYGDNDAEHDFVARSKGAFNETVKGILNLAEFNTPMEIRTVIHRYTYRQLTRLSEFIYRNMTFVGHVVFMGLETIGFGKNNLESLWVEPEVITDPLLEAVHHLQQRNIPVSIYNIPLCLLPPKLWSFARQSISDWKNSFDSSCVNCSIKASCPGLFNRVLKYMESICRLLCN